MSNKNSLYLIITIFIFSLSVSAITRATELKKGTVMEPPIAKVEPKITKIHGITLTDNYFWLRGQEKPEVIAYLKAENAYYKSIMKDTEKFQDALFKEMKARIKETDLSVPQKIDQYYYYSRTEEGKQYRIHCRKPAKGNGKEEVIFDENKYAEGKPYFSLGVLKISTNHKLLAYSIDSNGSEKFTLRFLNLETGKTYSESIASTTYSFQWANDNQTVFYTMMDKTGRSNRIYRHKLGTKVEKDVLVYEEKDGQFWTGIGKTKNRKYLVLGSSSSTTSESMILEADNPEGKFEMFCPRKKGIEYGIAHHNNSFYIVTNENAINFKVMTCSEKDFSKKSWKEFVPHNPDRLIADIESFEKFLVLYEREKGLQTIRFYNHETKKWKNVKFPEPVYSYSQDANPDYKTNLLRYTYTSLTTPRTVYDFNMDTEEQKLLKQYEVLGDFDSKDYQSERIFAIAKDGTQVPISLVYKKELKTNKPSPMYLTSYGSYGSSYDPYFSSIRLSLLNRGFTYAVAHIRGGQEMGRLWYENGKLLKKKNTFTDFIACAEHLIKKGYTNTEKLAINGGSAGGLLMGAVTNMRPDLFGVVVADVPFVDVINTMLDPSLPLVREEYEEWGNPNKKEFFDYMLSYSPYDNVAQKKYPTMLVTAGLNDPRVKYWEPAKLVAKLRAMKTDKNLLLLKTNMDAGHAGASGRYDFIKEIAFEYAFILKAFNMLDK